MIGKTICFTGHRVIRKKDAGKIENLKALLVQLIDEGYLYFLAGGARGFDMLAAETVLELQKEYPKLELILVLPFDKPYTVEKAWSKTEIERYKKIKKAATEILYVDTKYKRGCYYKRNRLMVSISSVCVAYHRKKTGGTAYTVEEAKKAGKRIINIADMEI